MELGMHLPEHVNALSEAAAHYGTDRWEDELAKAFQTPRSRIDRLRGDGKGIGRALRGVDVLLVGRRRLAGRLRRFWSSDDSGNCCRGRAVCRDSSGNIVFCENPDETVMLIGVEDLVVVRTGNRTLISARGPDRGDQANPARNKNRRTTKASDRILSPDRVY